MKLVTCGLGSCLTAAARMSGWKEKRSLPRGLGRVRRGIGMASMLHVGGGAKIYRSDGCGSVLSIDDFGKVTLVTGSTEIGQGSETVLAQIVAETLGVDIERVKIVNTDTDVKPWDVGVHASRTTYVAGNSALLAARQAREKLLGAAASQLKLPVSELRLEDGWVMRGEERVEAMERLVRTLHFTGKGELCITQAYFEPESVKQDAGFKGNVSPTYAFATHVTEVEVELDTGMVRVLGVYAAQMWASAEPATTRGTDRRRVVMGLGYALTEELKLRDGLERTRASAIPCATAPEVPPSASRPLRPTTHRGPSAPRAGRRRPSAFRGGGERRPPRHRRPLHQATVTPERVLRPNRRRSGRGPLA